MDVDGSVEHQVNATVIDVNSRETGSVDAEGPTSRPPERMRWWNRRIGVGR